jgi:hypothetical protein
MAALSMVANDRCQQESTPDSTDCSQLEDITSVDGDNQDTVATTADCNEVFDVPKEKVSSNSESCVAASYTLSDLL